MIRMAIMGAGAIAIKMVETVSQMNNIEPYAIAAREMERAKVFAEEYGVTKAYGSYEEMLQDKHVDLVYIAVPHTLHYKCAKMCLEAGKHVLCEKPFCVSEKEAVEIIQLAEKKHLLLTEAIWTRYMPSRTLITETISSGVLGEVTSLTANLGYELSQVKRIWDPRLAGGALLDVGVYLIHFARMVFGEKEAEITCKAVFKNGVDIIDSIIMTFDDGKVATMQSTVAAVQNRSGMISGTEGYMEITNINNPQEIRIYNINYELVQRIKVPEQISGYEYEVQACINAIADHKIECDEISHRETLKVMEIMDRIRSSWGYVIPEEK